MTILFEAYAGKTSNIKTAERELIAFVKEIKESYSLTDPNYNPMNNVEVNNNIHLKKATDALKKEFKFNNLTISMYSDRNAGYTMVTPFLFFKGDEKKHEISVYIYMSINDIIENNLSGPEVLAVLLHEIGHNTDTCVPTRLRFILRSLLYAGINIPITLAANWSEPKIIKLIDWIFQKTYLRGIIVLCKQLLSELIKFKRIDFVVQVPQQAILSLVSVIHLTFLGYWGERKSDSMAVKYGYGPELVSSLNKFKDDGVSDKLSEKIIHSNPFTGLLYDLTDAIMCTFSIFTTPHPSNVNRAKNALTKLERELQNPNIPSDLKKEIKGEIKELNEMINEMNKVEFTNGRYHVFRGIFNRLASSGNGRNRNILDFMYPAEKYEE